MLLRLQWQWSMTVVHLATVELKHEMVEYSEIRESWIRWSYYVSNWQFNLLTEWCWAVSCRESVSNWTENEDGLSLSFEKHSWNRNEAYGDVHSIKKIFLQNVLCSLPLWREDLMNLLFKYLPIIISLCRKSWGKRYSRISCFTHVASAYRDSTWLVLSVLSWNCFISVWFTNQRFMVLMQKCAVWSPLWDLFHLS